MTGPADRRGVAPSGGGLRGSVIEGDDFREGVPDRRQVFIAQPVDEVVANAACMGGLRAPEAVQTDLCQTGKRPAAIRGAFMAPDQAGGFQAIDPACHPTAAEENVFGELGHPEAVPFGGRELKEDIQVCQ